MSTCWSLTHRGYNIKEWLLPFGLFVCLDSVISVGFPSWEHVTVPPPSGIRSDLQELSSENHGQYSENNTKVNPNTVIISSHREYLGCVNQWEGNVMSESNTLIGLRLEFWKYPLYNRQSWVKSWPLCHLSASSPQKLWRLKENNLYRAIDMRVIRMLHLQRYYPLWCALQTPALLPSLLLWVELKTLSPYSCEPISHNTILEIR